MEIRELAYTSKIHLSRIYSLQPYSSTEKKRISSTTTSLPIPISHSEVKQDTMNRPSLMSLSSSYARYCKWINSKVLVFLIILLCLIRLSGRHFFCHCLHPTEHNAGFNSTSTRNEKHVFSHCSFSLPVNWSLDSVLICSSATRHIAVIPKTIKKGIYPMYMADPSESGQPATNTNKDPDWLLNLRKKDAERKRKQRAKATKEKAPVPGWMRTKQCRERKAVVSRAESSTVTQVPNSDARYTRKQYSPVWLYFFLMLTSFLISVSINTIQSHRSHIHTEGKCNCTISTNSTSMYVHDGIILDPIHSGTHCIPQFIP
jgi:hypothetical protein